MPSLAQAPPAAKAEAAPAPRCPRPAARATIRSTATFLSRRRLNKEGSEKETWHIEFDLAECGLDYVVGDSFGVYPANDAALVEAVIAALDAPPDFPIGGRTLREALTDGVSLSPAPDMLFQLISYLTGGDRQKKAKALAAGQDPDGDAATLDVLAALQKFPGIRPDPEAFIESLDALQPRVYSISSSLKCQSRPRLAHGRRGALRGGKAHPARRRLDFPGGPRFARRQDQGLCAEGAALRAAGRSDKPIIMIGPGTGLAPFRAFLQERQATDAPGPNWLYFGHQRSDYDFFYEDELKEMRSSRPADPADARLVARRQGEDLRAAPHARRRPRPLGVARATARISMSAAMPCAWRRTSNAR